jgi:hypothetical protein
LLLRLSQGHLLLLVLTDLQHGVVSLAELEQLVTLPGRSSQQKSSSLRVLRSLAWPLAGSAYLSLSLMRPELRRWRLRQTHLILLVNSLHLS